MYNTLFLTLTQETSINIMKMEKEGNKDNRHYMSIELDKYSVKQNGPRSLAIPAWLSNSIPENWVTFCFSIPCSH